MFFGNLLVSLFTQEAEIKDFAENALDIISIGFIFYGIGIVMINAFNGAGDTWTPTLVNLFGFWLFLIPLVYFLSKSLEMGTKRCIYFNPYGKGFDYHCSLYFVYKRKMENC